MFMTQEDAPTATGGRVDHSMWGSVDATVGHVSSNGLGEDTKCLDTTFTCRWIAGFAGGVFLLVCSHPPTPHAPACRSARGLTDGDARPH